MFSHRYTPIFERLWQVKTTTCFNALEECQFPHRKESDICHVLWSRSLIRLALYRGKKNITTKVTYTIVSDEILLLHIAFSLSFRGLVSVLGRWSPRFIYRCFYHYLLQVNAYRLWISIIVTIRVFLKKIFHTVRTSCCEKWLGLDFIESGDRCSLRGSWSKIRFRSDFFLFKSIGFIIHGVVCASHRVVYFRQYVQWPSGNELPSTNAGVVLQK